LPPKTKKKRGNKQFLERKNVFRGSLPRESGEIPAKPLYKGGEPPRGNFSGQSQIKSGKQNSGKMPPWKTKEVPLNGNSAQKGYPKPMTKYKE